MKLYEMFELIYEAAEPEGSHVNIDLEAEFTNGRTKKKVKGFYAGHGKYIVRFLPEDVGTWQYQVHGIITAKGELEVELAEDSHGMVKACGTHLEHEDGTLFCSFGTTVYGLAHQSEELTEQTFETLAKAPFNKVRMCVFPKHYNYNHNEPQYYPFEVLSGKEFVPKDALASPAGVQTEPVWDVNRPEFAFWDAFEEKIQRLGQMNIQVDLILFHPYDRWGFAWLTQKENLVYLDYLIRRFAAIPNIWWSMANEYDLCAAKTIENWYEIEVFIAANDPYQHLLSNHNCFPFYDFGRDAITHASIQIHSMNLVGELQEKYHKPVCYDECTYEGNLQETWGSISGQEMTRRFWEATVTGGYCTHGEVLLDQADENLDEAVLWWAKGGKLKGSSPARIAFLRKIMEEIGKPLRPYEIGVTKMLAIKPEEIQAAIANASSDIAIFLSAISKMGLVELIRHIDTEYAYFGHADEEVYLFYYGINCCARVQLEIPAEYTYRVEVIDTWNMTRELVMENASGKTEVRLPSREYMAVLATKID